MTILLIINIIITISLFNSIISIFLKNNGILYCGLIGYSSSKPFNDDKIKVLMMYNLSRGENSTGMYNRGMVIKDDSDVSDFLSKEILDPEKIFLGHTRQTTVGATNTENAHPFEFGDTVAIHNGTIDNWMELRTKYSLSYLEHNTDSKVVAAAIDKYDDNRIFKEFDGAAAVIFFNKNEPNTLYCYRNIMRPLYRGIIDGDMYISSMAESLLAIDCCKIKEFKTNYLYKIVDGSVVKTRKIARTPLREIDNSNIPYQRNSYNSHKDWYKNNVDNSTVIPIKKANYTVGGWAKCISDSCLVSKRGEYVQVLSNTDNCFYVPHVNKDGSIEENGMYCVNKIDYLPPLAITLQCYVECMYDGKSLKRGEICTVESFSTDTKEEEGYRHKAHVRRIPKTDVLYGWCERNFRKLNPVESAEMQKKIANKEYDNLSLVGEIQNEEDEEGNNEDTVSNLLKSPADLSIYLEKVSEECIETGDIGSNISTAIIICDNLLGNLNETSLYYNHEITRDDILKTIKDVKLINDKLEEVLTEIIIKTDYEYIEKE